jgi:2,3-bisphosphoglycerate-dependent phosphoglycerate mutase
VGVHLKASDFTYAIGSKDFFGSFFDTIDYHLTRGIFNKKYPTVLKEFYNGRLAYDSLIKAERELKDIQQRLKKLDPSKIIWDRDDLAKRPPWGDNISNEITDLSNYFVTSDGKDLFEVLFEAIEKARAEKADLIIA